MQWTPLSPDCFTDASGDGSPKMFKDEAYAKAVREAWDFDSEGRTTVPCETSPINYKSDDGSTLYGHIVRPMSSSKADRVPGVLFFHTGAGPHDIFLLWKAQQLIQSLNCYVFIADILSDDTGWAWDPDRTRYEQVRKEILPQSGPRTKLQERILAAYNSLIELENVDETRLGAMGWCLGGYPILELGRMKQARGKIRAMVTFHGVFGASTTVKESEMDVTNGSEVLICHGAEDPFVPQESLELCLSNLKGLGHSTRLLEFPDTKHGFTNPAQDFNDNPAFSFHENSANKAWFEATSLLKETLL